MACNRDETKHFYCGWTLSKGASDPCSMHNNSCLKKYHTKIFSCSANLMCTTPFRHPVGRSEGVWNVSAPLPLHVLTNLCNQWLSSFFVSRPILANHYNPMTPIYNSTKVNVVQLCAWNIYSRLLQNRFATRVGSRPTSICQSRSASHETRSISSTIHTTSR